MGRGNLLAASQSRWLKGPAFTQLPVVGEVGFPHTTKHFSDSSWASHNVTKFRHWRQHRIPQVQGPRLLPHHPLQKPTESPGCCRYVHSRTGRPIGGPNKPLLGVREFAGAAQRAQILSYGTDKLSSLFLEYVAQEEPHKRNAEVQAPSEGAGSGWT